MIIELLFNPIFFLIKSLISFIPEGYNIPAWGSHFLNLVSTALMFFPSSVYIIVVGNIVFWMTVHMVWAVIEWAYKKIPGVN